MDSRPLRLQSVAVGPRVYGAHLERRSWEKEFTGTFLTAHYGKGVYTYSSLVWYRQIPALVPGSIRMFVNMISQHQ